MNMLFQIFLLFAKISFFSFGGGYVAFPIIREANEQFHWMTGDELSNILSLAGMAPGPVAINGAVGFGYHAAGVPGVFAAFLGIAIPCMVIVTVVATFFFKVYQHPLVKHILYVLGAVITGVIVYAGISFAQKNGMLSFEILDTTSAAVSQGSISRFFSAHLFEIKSILLAACAFILLLKTKLHPILIIFGGAAAGILLF